ncbi:MAG: polysaccharide deacetylase, partial [Alphaproteobacteria bacterium]
MKADVLKAGLKAIYYTGTHRLLEPYTQGQGLIFMLHQVNPRLPGDFAPNHILTVSPDFLDAVLAQVRESGFDIVTLDEAVERLRSPAGGQRRFACFTLDDGYRDNRDHALPVFERHAAPFTVYVPSDFAEGRGELWWFALERIIAAHDEVEMTLDPESGEPERFRTRTASEKQAVFDKLYWWLRAIPEERQRAAMRKLCAAYGLDQAALCRELIMSWEELADFAAHPLVTIGSHTQAHYAVAKLEPERARKEMREGADRLEVELGNRPRHFSFPYGDPASAGPRDFALADELGFTTAVTTRKG